MVDLGGYDSHLFTFYVSDIDLWRRASLAGYERIEAGGDSVTHNGGGSATINSDAAWNICNGHSFSQAWKTYEAKWGGAQGSETFTSPFCRPDVFLDLKPLVP